MFGKKHLDINTQKHWRGTDKTVLKCKSFRLISYKWRQARCIKINPVGDNLRLRCHHHSAPTNKHLFSDIFLTELNINNNFRLIEKQAVLILKEKHVFWQKREPNICELWLRLIASLLQRNRRDYIYAQCTVHTHYECIASHICSIVFKLKVINNNNNNNQSRQKKRTSSNSEMWKKCWTVIVCKWAIFGTKDK